MFSNAKKFVKKNILLIGIVVLLIIIAVYFLYINVKEGFDGPAPEKAQLIPVSTIEKIYNNLPNQTLKDVGAPVVELYKLFVANYNDVFDVYLQIVAANKEIDAATVNIMSPSYDSSAPDIYYAKMRENEALRNRAQMEAMKKWAPIINPGIQKVLSTAIKWLPQAKQYYDKFVSNNYYGLLDGTFQQNNSSMDMLFTLSALVLNTLYDDNQLAVLLGPDFAKSSPTLPIPMPTSKEQLLEFSSREPSPELMTAVRRAQEYLNKYVQNLRMPIPIIPVIQKYLMDNARSDPVNSAIPNTILQLIEQLNTALANDATDQASIGQLTGQIGELTSKLNAASANDMTDQNTITRLQGQVYDLQSRQPPMTTQPVPAPPLPIAPLPVQPMTVQPLAIQPRFVPPRTFQPRTFQPRTIQPRTIQPSVPFYR